MNWDAIGAIGEVVGAIAVVVSLIYLAVQIKDNSKLLKMASDDSLMSRYAASLSLVAQTPENAYVFNRGMKDPESLTEDQLAHFGYMIGLIMTQIDYTYRQHQDGRISNEQWARIAIIVENYFSTTGVRQWWEKIGRRVIVGSTSEFGKYLEKEFSKYSNEPT